MSKELTIKVTDKNYDFLKRLALEDCRKLNDLISLIFITGLNYHWAENSISIKKEDDDYTEEEKKQINKALYYTELSWIKKICEDNFGKVQVFKNQLLKDDITIVVKRSA